MAVRPLVLAPDPRLKTPSAPVARVDDSIRELAADLFETMYHFRGIGLAAVQVGVLKRVLVVDVAWREAEGGGVAEKGEPMCLINAEVLWDADEMAPYTEGCLSFPEQFSEVERPKEVRVRYMDLDGKTHDINVSGLLATCIQHEIDHTNGITFVDHISSVKRDMILRKMQKGKKQGVFHDYEHIHVHGEHCNH